MKRLAIIVAVLVAVLIALLGGVLQYMHSSMQPLAESKLIANFYAHRAAYERLRAMLQEDKQLLHLAGWGVETTKSVGGGSIPPEGDFPVGRYQEYLAQLKETGGVGASRARGEHAESVSVLVWAAGFGGDTRHVALCWMEHEPPDQVVSLDDYYRTPKPRRPAFRPVEGNWYLWADW